MIDLRRAGHSSFRWKYPLILPRLAMLLVILPFSAGCSGCRSNRATEPSTDEATFLFELPDIVQAVAFSPDGQTLAAASQDGTIKLWDPSSGAEKATLGGDLNFGGLAFSLDGQTLASGGDEIEIWDLVSKNCKLKLTNPGGTMALAFSPDQKWLASGGLDRTAILFDLTKSKKRVKLTGFLNAVSSVAFSPDGRTLASASLDYTIRLWDVASGDLQRTLKGHTSGVSAIAFSPDGETLASGAYDGSIYFWDLATSELLENSLRQPGGVSCLAYSPDGSTLVVGGSQYRPPRLRYANGRPEPPGEARLWDIRTGELVVVLKGHEQCVSAVAYSPDGKWIATGSRDRTVRLWAVDDLLKK